MRKIILLLIGCTLAGCDSQPDLRVEISGPAHVRAGDDVEALMRIVASNQGDAPAPGTLDPDTAGYMVDLVLSRDSILPVRWAAVSPTFTEDMLLAGGRISRTMRLAPGESRAVSEGEASIAADTPPGRYCLGAVIDPGTRVAESDENNNTACHWIEVEAPAM